MSFFENTRKPVGLGGKAHGRHDESRAQPRGTVGASIFECLRRTPRCWTAAAAEGRTSRDF